MSRRPLWEEIYNRFDPDESVPLDHPEWRADRTYSPVPKILTHLGTPFDDARILLTGTVGAGKSTELLRVAESRSGEDFVVYLDLNRHFDKIVGNPEALQHITTWEICFLAALALYRAAQERLAFPWSAEVLTSLEAAWKAAAKASGTVEPRQIDLGKLAKSMALLASAGVAAAVTGGGAVAAAAGLTALGAAGEALRWNLPLGQAKQALPDDDEELRTMLAIVNRVVGELRQRHSRVLVILDGLDRIKSIERARTLFVDSDMLGRIHCPLVICAPFVLRHHPEINAVRRFQVEPLLNEPVLRRDKPTEPAEGRVFFFEAFRRRVRDLAGSDDLLSQELILKLAYYSGGRTRDFIKMIRALSLAAWHADLDRITDKQVGEVLDDSRRLIETGMHRGHIQVLESVMRDPDRRLPYLPQDEAGLVWDLLSSSRLLPYPNESEWFYPHPLLTMHLLRATGSTR